MPAEFLRFTPLYIFVGAYRFLTDASINRPIWQRTRKAAQKGALAALVWAVISLPFTRYYVRSFMKTALLGRYEEKSSWLGTNIHSYATYLLVLQQASFVLEWFIKKELKAARAHAYDATVASRGKEASFWMPYVEEWKEPPVERAQRSLERKSFLMKARSPWLRIILLKVVLQPLNFIPFLGLIVSASLASVTLARILHKPYFAIKRLTPYEEEMFIVERLVEYRSFGFAAALFERVPLVGLLFSVSNRIGAAMWAHDLEKRQHAFRSGELKPTKEYVSKTAQVAVDLPDEFAGGFPSHKGPVKIGGSL